MSLSILNNIEQSAVKALIYRKDGKILLQKRDYKPNLKWPGCWNLFGGLVEEKEKLPDALKRELHEELKIEFNQIDKKIFEWKSSDCITNFCFPIYFNIPYDNLQLMEGEKMEWFEPYELVNLKLTSFLENNISNILLFLKKIKPKTIIDYENQVIKKLKLIKKNERVFYTKNKTPVFNKHYIYLLQSLAGIYNIPLIRLCLHKNNDDLIHEMLMIHNKKHKVGPLRQNNSNSLSYHVLKGKGIICLYDKLGNKKKEILMDDNDFEGYTHCRLSANVYRTIESKTEPFVFIETSSGPFKDEDTKWFKQ